MGLDKTVRARAAKATYLLVDGEAVNPWLVGTASQAPGSPFRAVELHLGLPILIFELQQSQVKVERENILDFVLDDLKNHQSKALDGYLTIVRYVVKPPPRRKNYSWFARMFTSPASWMPPQPQWNWTSVIAVVLGDYDTLVIKGTCCDDSGTVLSNH